MASYDPPIVLALAPADREPVSRAIADRGWVNDVVSVGDRASLMTAAREHQPGVVVLDLSSRSGMGGSAMAGMIRSESPHTRILFICDDTERDMIDGLSAGDMVCTRPVDAGYVTYALTTLLWKGRLLMTGRYQKSRRFNPKATESAAMQAVALKLAAARSTGQVAEILKGTLSEVTPFDVFVFCEKAEDETVQPRIYLHDRVTPRLLLAADQVARDEMVKAFGDCVFVAPKVFGVATGAVDGVDKDETALDIDDATDLDHLVLPLTLPKRQVGIVTLLRRETFDLPQTVRIFFQAILTQASTTIARLQDVQTERLGMLRAVLESMSDGALWLDDRRRQVIGNKPVRRLLELGDDADAIPREAVDAALKRVGLYAALFGPDSRDKTSILKSVPIDTSQVRAALGGPPGAIAPQPGHDSENTDVQVELARVRDDRRMALGSLLIFRLGAGERADAESRQDYLNTLGHELKVPLNAVQGYTELLLEGGEGAMSDAQQDCLRKVLNNARRIHGLIANFLDSQRIAARGVRKRPIETETFLQSIVSSFEHEAERRRITVGFEIHPAAGSMLADADQLRIALNNLVSNAVKFTPEDGAITITARPSTAGGPHGESERLGETRRGATAIRRSFLAISVADTGIGVPESDHERIFEKFTQSATPLVPDREGNGLGLSIAREIVEAHGGRIWVEPTDKATGKGAKFTLTLPSGFAVAES